ncbi:MAG: helix-turn-helix domain-containing protein [Bacteroidales bacterium]|jgi:AraC-like DNA-binding protein|nr:helix-turn-helix domain-containing protein [Bacteroidales bacterium]
METSSQLRELTDFIEEIHTLDVHNYQNKIIVVELGHLANNDENRMLIPIRLNAFSIFLVMEGEFHITIDYKNYTVKKNSLFTLIDRHIINNVSSSEDFKGLHIMAEHDFFRSSTKDEKPPLEIVNSGKVNPIIELQENDADRLIDTIQTLKSDMLRSEHFYQERLITNSLANLVFEIWNIMMQQFQTNTLAAQQTTYEQIAVRFFDLLLKYGIKEHQVSFYADKLHISPIYLSRVIKEITGKTSIKVISDNILMEAILLLRNHQLTIQQIADKLNFSDQASFSKFFKKNTRKSPVEYRKLFYGR